VNVGSSGESPIRSVSPIILTPEQEAAVHNALREPISIISGGTGTGKTTIVKALAAVASENISACAAVSHQRQQ
jgi:Flp pilus assembly CpaF family ATPase